MHVPSHHTHRLAGGLVVLAAALLAAASLPAAGGAAAAGRAPVSYLRTRGGAGGGLTGTGAASALHTKVPQNGIYYHGGPVITSTKDVYLIWYGAWSSTQTGLVETFVGNIGGSPYFNINTTYVNGSLQPVSNSVAFLRSDVLGGEPLGSSLSDSDVATIVSGQITNGALPPDANGVYFLLTSPDVDETSGLDTKYCGFHTSTTVSGTVIQYAFVGNPDRAPSACEAQTTSPNNDSGVDGMVSIMAHELEESATDPHGDAWYDRKGAENADKCAWTFGTQSTAANGSNYNMVLGGLELLIQQNWVNASRGYCALSY